MSSNQQFPQDPNRPFVPAYGAGPNVPPGPNGYTNVTPGPNGKKPMGRGVKIGWGVLSGLIVFTIGVLAGAGGAQTPTPAAAGVAAPTVTVSVPGQAAEGAGATVTVTAPPATVTAPAVPPVTVTKPAPPARTVTAAPPEAAGAIEGDGTYEVGADIKAGKYKTSGGSGCYWARLRNLEGDVDSIIANNIGDGPQTITIKKSDKGFETTRCGTWKKVG
jgi:hypothetical protein